MTKERLPAEIVRLILSSVENPLPIYDSFSANQQRRQEQATLHRLAQVNRLFNDLAQEFLWRDPVLPSITSCEKFLVIMQRPSLALLQRTYARVSRLDLRNVIFTPANIKLLFRILRACPYIQILGINSTCLDHGLIQDISGLCPLLQGLALAVKYVAGGFYDDIILPQTTDFLNLGRSWVPDSVVVKIASTCPNLTSVWLEECSDLTDYGITILASKCQNLRTLKLRNCVRLTDDGVVFLVKALPRLEELGISYTRCTDETLLALAEHSTRLRKLFINDLSIRREETLIKLFSHRGQTLKTLGMSGTESLGLQSIIAISNFCPFLEELDIGSCNLDNQATLLIDDALLLLADKCLKLRNLVLPEPDEMEHLSPHVLELLRARFCMDQFWLEPPLI